MRQAAAIRDATDPDEILFVVDAMIGQDAVTTAQAFLDGVGYDGVVLTKLDGDARGGAALSIAQLTGRPVMFASTGEKLEDFDLFHPDRMASRILDMGDMLTLIEQAERTFDEEQTAAMAGKLASGEGFTLEDFVEQLAMVRKLGPIGNLLGMLPGAAQNRELLSQVNDKDLDRAAAIVNSMTPPERRNPKILNGSRRARIARGSGTSVGEVNNLVIRFQEGQKMMRQMFGGGGMPGMPPIPGMRRATKKARQGPEGTGEEEAQGRRAPAPPRGPAAARAATSCPMATARARAPRSRPGAACPPGWASRVRATTWRPAWRHWPGGTPVSLWCRKTTSPRPGPPPPTCPPASAASAAASGATASHLAAAAGRRRLAVRRLQAITPAVNSSGTMTGLSLPSLAVDALSRSPALVRPGACRRSSPGAFTPAAELSWEKTAAVAVKIKLKRMGKIRAPFYRIIVADARTKRDGRAIEEIGKYHPKAEPSFIEVNSDRAQHWLSVGAQPTDPVRRILEITGDWQKFKGLPGTEGTLKTAEAKADKKEAFAAAVAETLKAADAKPDKGRARKPPRRRTPEGEGHQGGVRQGGQGGWQAGGRRQGRQGRRCRGRRRRGRRHG